METEFNLSEKIENTESIGWVELPPFIPIEDVKEFIRLCLTTASIDSCNGREVIDVGRFKELAGDKLI